MPYTPPSQRSPAVSTSTTPSISRRASYNTTSPTTAAPAPSRPELPRSTSYLTRHRRTPSVKTASFAQSPTANEPSPPGTADSENNEANGLKINTSLRQSPPPVTDETSMPAGAIISPPDSLQGSGDEEEEKERGRALSNLAELQAAIRNIGQHRDHSPPKHVDDAPRKTNQVLTLQMPSKVVELSPRPLSPERSSLSQEARKISHSRSSTEPSVFIDLKQDDSQSPTTGSDEDEEGGSDDPDRSRRKPPMLRKKSGELVRPALRPSSSRRRPSSMPGTPTFSKAVHFDSHLEHVRHFLQVDRPLAVSAGSSPVESYESESEFPFSDENEDAGRSRTPPFEWEIVVSNFPAETPERLALPVRVERVYLSADNKMLIGSVAVANLAFHKLVVARFSLDYWKTTSEVVAEFNNDIRRKQQADGYDRFNFNIKLADLANLEAKTMFFCVKYAVNGIEYWDNNNNTNFQVDFKKKFKPQNGKKGKQGASSRTANGLPRSQRKASTATRPRSMPTTFDDFADGFDSRYDFPISQKPVDDYLGDSGPVRLKGVKSAITLSTKPPKKPVNPSGQAFANRYDFGASLSAAIQAANAAMGDRSGIVMKPSIKKQAPTTAAPPHSASNGASKVTAPFTATTGASRAIGLDKPVLSSESYNELLDKYCFFGSSKNSPQLKDGTIRPSQYDGSDDRSGNNSAMSSLQSSASGSPALQMPQRTSGGNAGAAQSAPITGFVTGTSSMYPYNRMGGFFNETHAATAIRG